MIEALLSGLLAGYGIAVPVGAVAALLVSLTARTSLRVGAFAALGVATADGGYGLLAVIAGSAVAAAVRPIAGPLAISSGLILLGLAIFGAVQAVRRHRSPDLQPDRFRTTWTARRAYLSLLAITALNPATIVYFTALVLGNGSSVAATAPRAVAFVLAVFVASASWQLLLAGGGAVLGQRLTSARGRLITAIVSSVIIAGLAVEILLTA